MTVPGDNLNEPIRNSCSDVVSGPFRDRRAQVVLRQRPAGRLRSLPPAPPARPACLDRPHEHEAIRYSLQGASLGQDDIFGFSKILSNGPAWQLGG